MVWNVKSVDDRKKLIRKPKLLDKEQTQKLLNHFTDYHTAFCLDAQERGEIDLVEMEIHRVDKASRKVVVWCMPFKVHQEVAKQLCNVQKGGIMEPTIQ